MTAAAKPSATDSFNEIATVRIELRDTDPPIWRAVEVPTSVTLKVLHDIVQAVMGWFDQHLWEFTIAKQRYGLPMDEDWGTEPRFEAAKVRLRDVLKARRTVIDYLYDFGDSWQLRLVVTGVRQGEPGIAYPRYVGGEWNAPPEDCGGIPGFYEALDAWRTPSIRTTPKSPIGSRATIPRRSTNCRSRSRWTVLPNSATPPTRASRKKLRRLADACAERCGSGHEKARLSAGFSIQATDEGLTPPSPPQPWRPRAWRCGA